MATTSAAYHWIECPHCASEAPNLDVMEGHGHNWVLTTCHVCARPFEVMLTQQAMFSIRQVPERFVVRKYERCMACGVPHQEPCPGLDGKGLGCTNLMDRQRGQAA